jgi:predicted RNase H-like HicB family nuclease
MALIEIEAEIHQENGMYWAKVATHPGLFASGATLDEVAEALGEAWSLTTRPRRLPRASGS